MPYDDCVMIMKVCWSTLKCSGRCWHFPKVAFVRIWGLAGARLTRVSQSTLQVISVMLFRQVGQLLGEVLFVYG